MADPTQDDILAFNTVSDVAAWAGLSGDPANVESPLGAVLSLLGAAPDTPARVVGVVAKPILDGIVGSFRVGNPLADPTPVQRGEATLFIHGCRIKAGVIKTAAQTAAEQQARAVAAVAAAAQPPQALAPQPVPQGSVLATVRLSHVVNPAFDESVPLLTEARIVQGYTAYRAIFGRMPEDQQECTAEQITGISYLLSMGMIYVDFSVFGPFGHRMLRKMKLSGYEFRSDGTLHTVEMTGPGSLQMWLESYAPFVTGCIMMEAVALGNLENYRNTITEYARRYGSACWSIIYQADVRTRREKMERVRRRGAEEQTQALAAGRTHLYDPAKPWNWVFAEIINDMAWWRKELEDPCLLFLTRTKTLGSMMGDDAPTGAEGRTDRSNTVRPRQDLGQCSDEPQRTKKRKPNPVHNVANGQYTANRRGNRLCNKFQDGSCNTPVRDGAGCPDGQHQCAKCLSTMHGSKNCPSDGPPAHNPARRFKGKGKGKGKRN
jgi:hypothetical protein